MTAQHYTEHQVRCSPARPIRTQYNLLDCSDLPAGSTFHGRMEEWGCGNVLLTVGETYLHERQSVTLVGRDRSWEQVVIVQDQLTGAYRDARVSALRDASTGQPLPPENIHPREA